MSTGYTAHELTEEIKATVLANGAAESHAARPGILESLSGAERNLNVYLLRVHKLLSGG